MLKFEFWDGRVVLQTKCEELHDLVADIGMMIGVIYNKTRERSGAPTAEVFKIMMQCMVQDDNAPVWEKRQFSGVMLENSEQLEAMLRDLAERKEAGSGESHSQEARRGAGDR